MGNYYMSKLKDMAKTISRINTCGGCSCGGGGGGGNSTRSKRRYQCPASSIITKHQQQHRGTSLEPGRESCYIPSSATGAIRNVSPINLKVLDTRYLVRRPPASPEKSKKKRGPGGTTHGSAVWKARHPFPKIQGDGRPVVVCNDCTLINSSSTDMMITVNNKNLAEDGGDYSFSNILLPPILTKPKSVVKKDPENSLQYRRYSSAANAMQRLKMRAEHSPRTPRSRSVAGGKTFESEKPAARKKKKKKKSLLLPESFVMVKSSSDPHAEFRESMVEMIVENNIRSGRGLEELLACYLSLNSGEYHDLIVEVFRQIWSDLNDLYEL